MIDTKEPRKYMTPDELISKLVTLLDEKIERLEMEKAELKAENQRLRSGITTLSVK